MFAMLSRVTWPRSQATRLRAEGSARGQAEVRQSMLGRAGSWPEHKVGGRRQGNAQGNAQAWQPTRYSPSPHCNPPPLARLLASPYCPSPPPPQPPQHTHILAT
jgi:hypothetical protein